MKKSELDFPLLKALVGKQIKEGTSSFGKGRSFDVVGFLLKFALAACLVTVFVIFFSKFLDLYLTVKINGAADPGARQFEMLTLCYSVIFLALVVNGVGSVNKSVFGDDLKIYSALPIDSYTLYLSKAVAIYFKQFIVCLFTILPVNLTFAFHAAQTPYYFVMTGVLCLIFPMISMAVSSIVALPVHAVKRFLRNKFILSFVLVTLLTAAGFFVYSQVLEAIKRLLLGDELRYFFNEQVMNGIIGFANWSYPARWLSDLLLLRNVTVSAVCLAVLIAACLFVSAAVIRALLTRAMQQKISGDQAFVMLVKPSRRRRSVFSALLGKEFNAVFRTPGYMFSYFSVAVLMPLMVYFCMTIGNSLVKSLIFVDCSLEIAILLTVLFGVLTNTFCATNISRDGMMFYSVKAMPVSARQVVLSKVVFCLIVTAASNLISAVVLAATGNLLIWQSLVVFGVGLLLGFAQICFATHRDFVKPRFSTEVDGEIRESNNTISTIIVVGLVLAALVGGVLIYYKMKSGLFDGGASWVTCLVVGLISLAAALLSSFLLLRRLNRKYYEFSGGMR